MKTCKVCPKVLDSGYKQYYCCNEHRELDRCRYSGETIRESIERKKRGKK